MESLTHLGLVSFTTSEALDAFVVVVVQDARMSEADLVQGSDDWDDTILIPTEIGRLCNGVPAPTGYATDFRLWVPEFW